MNIPEIMTEASALSESPRLASEPLLRWFRSDHLRPDLREVVEPFANLARTLVIVLARTPERTVSLRKLLEAKDAAVRSAVVDAESGEL